MYDRLFQYSEQDLNFMKLLSEDLESIFTKIRIYIDEKYQDNAIDEVCEILKTQKHIME